MSPRFSLRALLLALALLGPLCGRARGQAGPPGAHDDVAFDVMNVLHRRGLHDLAEERWNVYGQLTYISSFKLPFSAKYTNLNGSSNSLSPDFEHGFTASLTLFLGARLWRGGEVYFVPEAISERGLSDLHGLGGAIQNFELQKTGSAVPTVYRSRLFLRQTFALGGTPLAVESNPMQLGSTTKTRRIVLTFGNFSALDLFDRNGVTGDSRQLFVNMAFMTHAAWDFAADARGYTFGLGGELYWDDWALRLGRMQPPAIPNTLPVDLRFWIHYSDTLELEHDHRLRGRPGAVRLLVYHNRVHSGRFDEAVDAFARDPALNARLSHQRFQPSPTDPPCGSDNLTAPDLCWVRRTNDKWGVGLNLEQYVSDDIGLFLRALWSDGRSEVDAFNAADRDLSFGAVAKGTAWHRPFDVSGAAVGLSWISESHARYLQQGGVDGFIGDGGLRVGTEGLFETFYSVNFVRALWLTGDFQLIWNPGYNRDRAGPVTIFGVRVHAEF